MDTFTAEPYPHLVGLIGKPRSGKSSVASILEREHGYVRLSVADPIRDALEVLDPLIALHPDRVKTPTVRLSQLLKDSDWCTLKNQHPEVRRLLQVLGTDVAREMWTEDFWLRTLVERIHHHEDACIVVDDVRFRNEAVAIRELGGFIVKLDRSWGRCTSGLSMEGAAYLDEHPCEREDLPHDLLIHNDGGLECLAIQTTDLIEDLDQLLVGT